MPTTPVQVSLSLAVLALTGAAASAVPGIINPSFEQFNADRYVTGWNALDDPDGLEVPMAFGVVPGGFAAWMSRNRGGQTVTLNAGDVVLFDVYASRLDASLLFPNPTQLQVWLCPPDRAEPLSNYPWDPSTPTQWNGYWANTGSGNVPPLSDQLITGSVTAPFSGTYTLGFRGDGWRDQYSPREGWLFLDNFRIVPAPGAAALFGIAGLLAARRRRGLR